MSIAPRTRRLLAAIATFAVLVSVAGQASAHTTTSTTTPTAATPTTATPTTVDSGKTYDAGLVTLCSTDTYLRIGTVNNSPKPVTITAVEKGSNGKDVELLNTNASDELKALFPITIPANSKNAKTFDLPLPAHLGGKVRPGNDRSLHGSWLPKQWHDENGLDYKGTSGTGAPNGTSCIGGGGSTSTTSCPPTSTTTVVAPSAPVQVQPVTVESTTNSLLATKAFDGDPSTEFVTQMLDWAPPTWAWLSADLGQSVPLTRIEWMWSAADSADAFKVEVSPDGKSWSTLGQPNSAPVGEWTGLTVTGGVRLVKFSWRNPKLKPQLGHLAEVRLWAGPGFVPDDRLTSSVANDIHTRSENTVGAPSTPATKGDHYVVKGSARSSNSPDKSSKLPLDGKADTEWQTSLTVAPRSGWVMYDLGDVVALPTVQWKFSQLGFADNFLVQVSNDGNVWSTLATETNAATPNTWNTLTVGQQTRFVRFFFTNPNNDANVGFLSEVRFLAPS